MKENAESLDVAAQVRFGDNGLEVDQEVDTGLDDWGVVDPGPARETRYEEQAASEFGVDDRDDLGDLEAGEQETLVSDVEQDQVTLSGKQAATQSKW